MANGVEGTDDFDRVELGAVEGFFDELGGDEGFGAAGRVGVEGGFASFEERVDFEDVCVLKNEMRE